MSKYTNYWRTQAIRHARGHGLPAQDIHDEYAIRRYPAKTCGDCNTVTAEYKHSVGAFKCTDCDKLAI